MVSDDTIGGYKIHPAAAVWPFISGEDWTKFVASIRERGLLQPIVVLNETVIDGRNRLRACLEAKVEPRFVQYTGAKDERSILDYLVSINERRRHLTESQRAIAGSKIMPMYEAAAKARQAHGTTAPGKPTLQATLPEASPRSEKRQARDDAAAAVDVSGRLISDAKKVVSRAPSAVVEAIEAGEVTVSDAVKIADCPHEEQTRALEKVRGGEARSLAGAAKGEASVKVHPNQVRAAEEDARILAIYDDSNEGGGSASHTAKLAGVTAHRVQDAVRRSGRRDEKNVLGGATESARSQSASWAGMVDFGLYKRATDEQCAALAVELREAARSAKKLARAIEVWTKSKSENEEEVA